MKGMKVHADSSLVHHEGHEEEPFTTKLTKDTKTHAVTLSWRSDERRMVD
jgi:hypothetical protein